MIVHARSEPARWASSGGSRIGPGGRPLLTRALVLLAGISGAAVALEPATESKQPDWQGLTAQFDAGDYATAVATAANIAELVRPEKRDPAHLPKSIALIQALMKRGSAELRLGDLDGAESSLLEAYRTFKDRDFQRLFSLQARLPKNIVEVVAVQMMWVELLDLRARAALERLRARNRASAATDPSAAPADAAQIDEWLDDFSRWTKQAAGAREDLAKQFGQGGAKVLTSPRCRALAGSFRPALNEGIKSLELARLARAGQPPAAPATAADRKDAERAVEEFLAAAQTAFEQARAALDEALAAALPKVTTGLKPEQRIEAALLQAELATDEAAALIEAGELTAARERLAQALNLRQEISTLRKRPPTETHPDAVLPLLLAAEGALAESRRLLAENAADTARAEAIEASRLLSQAEGASLPDDHPLAGERVRLTGRLQQHYAAIEKSIPRSDAADTAARRIRRGIDSTPPAAAAF
jgi:hypothetical protein